MKTLDNGLQVELNESAPCCMTGKLVAPAAMVKKAYSDVLTKYMAQVRQPGFRAGHAPKSLVLKLYGSAVREEASANLIDKCIIDVLRDSKMSIAGDIEWKDGVFPVINDENADLPVEFSCEIFADFELPKYRGLALTSDEKAVSEEEIDKTYDSYVRSRGTYAKVERVSSAGDMLKVDYTADADEETKADKSAAYLLNGNNSWISLREPEMLPGVTTILAGLKAEDSKDATIEFPKDFRCAALAGKSIAFHFTVREVHGYSEPELNEEFFKSFGVKNADELKASIRQQMEYYAAQMANMALNDQIVKALTGAVSFPLPPKMLAGAIKKAVDDKVSRKRDGKASEEEIKAAMPEFEREATEEVTRDIRLEQILGKIGETEKIQVGESDIFQYCQNMAQRHGMKLDDVFKMLRKNHNAIQNIAANILNQKAMALVFDNAEITFTDPKVAAARAEQKAKAAAAAQK